MMGKWSYLIWCTAGTLVLILIVAGLLKYLVPHSGPQLFGKAITSVNTTQKVVALTFDDGPNSPYTEQILDVLKKT